MRRIAVKLCVFLLLGAVVNVAVAWVGCCLIERRGPRPYMLSFDIRTVDDEMVGLWNRHWSYGWLKEGAKSCFVCYCAFAEYTWISTSDGVPGDFPYHPSRDELRRMTRDRYTFIVTQTDTGFPLCSLRFEEWSAQQGIAPGMDCHDGLAVGKTILPVRVIPVGFALNTLIYAAIFWLLFAFPFTMRRWRRVRRGLCAKCAYPVGASDVCTECGASVNHRSMGLPPPAAPAGSGSEATS